MSFPETVASDAGVFTRENPGIFTEILIDVLPTKMTDGGDFDFGDNDCWLWPVLNNEEMTGGELIFTG